MDRVFLVGCPRSGTTLLQTMLAQHPSVFTVPETHYFLKLRGRLAGRPVGPMVSPRSAARALDGLANAAALATRPSVPRWWPLVDRYGRAFVGVMDAGAQARASSLWIEKSPIHLHHMVEIARYVPEARFLHMLRDGRDVVASLVDLCEREPDRWVPQLISGNVDVPSRGMLIHAAAARWNGDLNLSLACRGRRGHHLLTYESLVEDSRATLAGVAAFLRIEYDAAMERHWESADEVVGPRREMQHMEKTFQPLEDRRLQRFTAVFSAEEQEWVTGLLDHNGDARSALAGEPV